MSRNKQNPVFALSMCWVCVCVCVESVDVLGVCVCVYHALPSVAGVPGFQPHYKSHKYHLTLLQQAGFNINLFSCGVSRQPFSTITLHHTSGEESYTPAQAGLPRAHGAPLQLSLMTVNMSCFYFCLNHSVSKMFS